VFLDVGFEDAAGCCGYLGVSERKVEDVFFLDSPVRDDYRRDLHFEIRHDEVDGVRLAVVEFLRCADDQCILVDLVDYGAQGLAVGFARP